jgi:hypothetical protein
MFTKISAEYAAFFFRGDEAACSCKVSVNFFENTQCHIKTVLFMG